MVEPGSRELVRPALAARGARGAGGVVRRGGSVSYVASFEVDGAHEKAPFFATAVDEDEGTRADERRMCATPPRLVLAEL